MADVNALRLAPNAGYASAVKSGQILLVTIAAYWLFPDQRITAQGISGIVFIVIGSNENFDARKTLKTLGV